MNLPFLTARLCRQELRDDITLNSKIPSLSGKDNVSRTGKDAIMHSMRCNRPERNLTPMIYDWVSCIDFFRVCCTSRMVLKQGSY